MSPHLNKWFYTNFLKDTFWVHFKTTITHNEGLQVNTISRSYTHWLVNSHLLALQGKRRPYIAPVTHLYLKTVSIVVGSFSKTDFNRQVTLSIILVLLPYYAFCNRFHLTYNFLFISNNFMLLNFFNLFYFKVHTY